MDARVNAFLNEINEIAPLSDKNDCVWEKCYDDDSGYYYYWNTKTNEVTWDMPVEYKSKQHQQQKKKPVSLYMPPRTAPLFPSTSGIIPPVSDAIKIYKIGQSTDTLVTNNTTNVTTTTTVTTTVPKVQTVDKTTLKHKEEDKVEINTKLLKEPKVALISSYDDDSDSEVENTGDKISNGSTTVQCTENETNKLINSEDKSNDSIELSGKSKDEISGFSLVAGYGSEDDDNSDIDNNDNKQKSNDNDNKVAHSTLFPITKPISIKDFEESDKNQNDGNENENFIDSKAFQRKRRIGVALINTIKKTKLNDNDENLERKGLGFSKQIPTTTATTNSCKYPGFTSGGVLFIKSNNPSITDKDDVNDSKDIQDSYLTLKEKLSFLSEGHEEVSPVQLMLIQLETLYTALKSGDLKQKYLRKWLDDTCGDLIKLEKETTPEGWLLQWDRCHKRYYYQNETTGESQWEYPETDVTRRDEAMDISTTPPPQSSSTSNHEDNAQSPKTSSPTPPIIDDKKSTKLDIGDSNEGNSEESLSKDPETSTNQTKEINDNLSEALTSFYSDIAAIENSNSPPPTPIVSITNDENKSDTTETIPDVSKKKKKNKVKLVQGIAMKKKGVSKLVEKWKNVQLSYSD